MAAREEISLEALMLRVQDGDKAAYASLLTQAQRLIERYVYKRVSVREDVPDIVQEILVSLHKARHSYQPDKPFSPWLYAICYYRLQDYFRHTYRSREDACEDFSMVMDVLCVPADQQVEQHELLKKLLSHLHHKQRTIVQKLYLEGCSAKEVAEQLHISVSDVRTSAHRAMKTLRKEMEGLL